MSKAGKVLNKLTQINESKTFIPSPGQWYEVDWDGKTNAFIKDVNKKDSTVVLQRGNGTKDEHFIEVSFDEFNEMVTRPIDPEKEFK